jgi:hypothetical protein
MQDWRVPEYLDAHAILICFAISSPDGFRNAAEKVGAYDRLPLSLAVLMSSHR